MAKHTIKLTIGTLNVGVNRAKNHIKKQIKLFQKFSTVTDYELFVVPNPESEGNEFEIVHTEETPKYLNGSGSTQINVPFTYTYPTPHDPIGPGTISCSGSTASVGANITTALHNDIFVNGEKFSPANFNDYTLGNTVVLEKPEDDSLATQEDLYSPL